MEEQTPTEGLPTLEQIAAAETSFVCHPSRVLARELLALRELASQSDSRSVRAMELAVGNIHRLDALEGREGGAAGCDGLSGYRVPIETSEHFRQRAETAERERDMAKAARASNYADAIRFHDERDQMERERDAARAALRKYGVHPEECRHWGPNVGDRCTCGLTDALESKEAPNA